MRYLKWPFYILLLAAYVYLVFLYPQSNDVFSESASEPSLSVKEAVDTSRAEISFRPVEEVTPVPAPEAPEPQIQAVGYQSEYRYLLLAGQYDAEATAEKRKAQLSALYIASRVVFIDGKYRLLLAETNDLGRARTLKADNVALGVSVYIREN